jgi:PBP1b-binding outer membrane lipoprotein LpoB
MDRKLLAIGILAVIATVVAMSDCTSGPATNATVKPTPANVTVVNKTMTSVGDVALVGNNTTMPAANPVPMAANNTTQMPPAVNNSTMPL